VCAVIMYECSVLGH